MFVLVSFRFSVFSLFSGARLEEAKKEVAKKNNAACHMPHATCHTCRWDLTVAMAVGLRRRRRLLLAMSTGCCYCCRCWQTIPGRERTVRTRSCINSAKCPFFWFVCKVSFCFLFCFFFFENFLHLVFFFVLLFLALSDWKSSTASAAGHANAWPKSTKNRKWIHFKAEIVTRIFYYILRWLKQKQQQ